MPVLANISGRFRVPGRVARKAAGDVASPDLALVFRIADHPHLGVRSRCKHTQRKGAATSERAGPRLPAAARVIVICAVLGASSARSAAPPSSAIRAIRRPRLGRLPMHTCVTIECNRRSSIRSSRSRILKRLVVDLSYRVQQRARKPVDKIAADDPNIKPPRAGRFKPGVVLVVMELKNEVKPQVFEFATGRRIRPSSGTHVYPLEYPSPAATPGERMKRRPTVVRHPSRDAPEQGNEIKPESRQGKAHRRSPGHHHTGPGHGGEDPGASLGVAGSYEKHVTLAVAKRLKERC